MAAVTANGITIEYEAFGDAGAPAILLIMGLGMQLIAWPDAFCGRLAAAGFRVVRFDNRDAGLSQKFAEAGIPHVGRVVLRSWLGLPIRAPYRLDDMALDAVGLLDTLGIPAAHVVGASMGGMIAQIVAARHPGRTRSLTSIMSTSGARHLPQASLQIRREMLAGPDDPTSIESIIERYERIYALIGSPGYPTPAADLRARLRRSVERGYYPAGFLRQFTAILASGDRSPLLRRIACPTLVIHGKADALVPCEGGVDTARKIRDAKLVLLDGWGHDLPAQLHDKLAGLIVAHAREAAA